MAKPSHNQKRKAKLKKRAERSRKHEPLAYSGKKYKTDENAPIFLRTEVGIYESYVMCDFKLTDDDVEAAIEQLVIQMRDGSLPPESESDEVTITDGGEEDLIIANIRRNWRYLDEAGELPGRNDLIGILRTILNSIEIWRSQTLHPQGYLHFIEGFVKKVGVTVQRVIPAPRPLPSLEE
ncbi:hypothetical protein SAMN05444166_2649 [Singulisphaera sp. GP187]|uniref:hypothetical protein n=1 Tax=Singulisphaera sp. GP187 TaxID=1882752 RepID=UPI000926600C|nr:hypothetical protein [Singulisphaera sp. GP187]SIO13712.1 hypothetical protein SAMN05444166_2649 [Singulisphaera sp. GP187]